MMLRIKFLLLNFAVGLSASVFLQNSSSERAGTTRRVTCEETNATRSRASNATVANDLRTFPRNITNQQDEKKTSNKTIGEMLRGVSTCRERPSVTERDDVAFEPSFRGIKPEVGRNVNVSVFHCKVSKELLEGLSDKLHQLETFQGIIVLYPKSRSSFAYRLSGSGAEEKNRRGSSSPRKRTGRPERDVLLKNYQLESNTKVPQISHIYLGRSLYPFLTEVSRVIGKDHTLPPPAYTRPTYNDHDKKWRSDT